LPLGEIASEPVGTVKLAQSLSGMVLEKMIGCPGAKSTESVPVASALGSAKRVYSNSAVFPESQ